MNEITRPGTERLNVHDCPVCGSNVNVYDCGYSSFNPGTAECKSCQLAWDLGCVNDRWDAGVEWNKLAAKLKRRLEVFQLISVKRESLITRDFSKEKLEDEAIELLAELRKKLIGAKVKK